MAARPLALTLGEPAGIGPDITLAAWRRRAELDLPPFYLLADPRFLARRARAARPRRADRSGRAARRAAPLSARAAGGRSASTSPPQPGRPDAHQRAGRDRLDPPRRRRRARRRAPPPSSPIRSPRTCSTAPASPSPATPNISPGSPRSRPAIAVHPVMMLWSPELAVVPVTIHLPLREVVARLTTELIVETGRIVARDLARALRHRAAAPRGRRPQSACRRGRRARRGGRRPWSRPRSSGCSAEGIDARGPLPADTMFHAAARATYDVALVHVSRPGADPDQDAGLRPRRQRHARPAVRAHLARPRHRLRHRRHRPRRSVEPDRRAQACGAACRANAEPRLSQLRA